MDQHPIDRLYTTVASRKGTNPERSYTAQLMKKGVAQCAKKLGEEGVEAALAAVGGRRKEIVAESADLLYHLLVVWAKCGIKPKAIYDELARREGSSGLAEKKARRKRK